MDGIILLGAILAIVFGNATAFAFKALGLARIHRMASVVLPLVAALAFAMLLSARGSGTINIVSDGIWERLSVYTITCWELLSAACLIGFARRQTN